MNLENKNIVITGGAGGIGAAMARIFAKKGAKIVVSDLNLSSAEAIAKEIDGIAIACDVSNEEQVRKLINLAEAHFGDIDLFCSNAGLALGEPSHAASASNDDWMLNWQVHVMAHVYASRALLPKMIERGEGYLLNVASAAGLLCQIGDAAYSATKNAAVSLAQSIAITHADDGIKVSVVCPQYVKTDLLGLSEEQSSSPLPGVISVEDCAKSILKGVEDEDFLILPHPEVKKYMAYRSDDTNRWIDGMTQMRRGLVDDKGKVDLVRAITGS